MSALAELQAKYSPALSEGVLRDCLLAARKEAAEIARQAGAGKLAEYEKAEAHTVILAGVQATTEAIVRALEGV